MKLVSLPEVKRRGTARAVDYKIGETNLRAYNQVPFWENRHRVKRLKSFLALVKTYFTNTMPGCENAKASEVRSAINLALTAIPEMVQAADAYQTIQWRSSPATGGHKEEIDLFDNLFYLHEFKIPPTDVTDVLERAIGVYQDDYGASRWRTINPLWWAGQVPFLIMGAVGFNADKIQGTAIGRTIRFVFQTLSATSALLTLLHWLGWISLQ